MEKDCTCQPYTPYGAEVERGEIIECKPETGEYRVRSLSRSGIVTPFIPAMHQRWYFEKGEAVYFFLFNDGHGMILFPFER